MTISELRIGPVAEDFDKEIGIQELQNKVNELVRALNVHVQRLDEIDERIQALNANP